MKLGFLASNNGSGMRAIVAAIEAGELMARARLVVSNRREAPALAFAQAHGIPTSCLPTQADPEGADRKLAEAMGAAGVDLILLSGYLRKLGPRTLGAFEGRILNIHPALLPCFGGQGMYGRRVHEAVIRSGASESGATVHVVDEFYDHGPIIAQARVPLLKGDTGEDLERRVTAVEPELFVDTLQRLIAGELILPGFRG